MTHDDNFDWILTDGVSEKNGTTEYLLELRRKQTELTEQIIYALIGTVEAKDHYTNGHSQRVASYAREIARRMGADEEQQRRVYFTGLLHDIGKIRIPDYIINKTDLLTESEYAEMKLHTLAGYYMLKEISAVKEFAIGARWHHERYDGQGYPNGLVGKDIPLISRIICVADAYDAMTSNRSYRQIIPQETMRAEMLCGAGAQFDPYIARIMVEMIDDDKDYTMHEPDPIRNKTILAIDDDPMVTKFLEFSLKRMPEYSLVSAESGMEGLEILRREHIDLVLLDVEMRGMDGFETLEVIRKEFGKLPVIFMTGEKDLKMIMRAESMGISDYLTKPIIPHILFESVQNVLLSSTYGRII